MRSIPLLFLFAAPIGVAWVVTGCSSSMLFADDDDDDSQGIVTDDDDDDDDTGSADDDDDDTSSASDDDDVVPPVPALSFTVPDGSLAGFHDFPVLWCGYDEEDGYWLLQGGIDGHWGEGFMMAIYHEPLGNEHVEDILFGWWGGSHGWAEATGSADCYLELVDPLPAASGTFQCLSMMHWESGQQVFFDVVEGIVQCPP